MINTQRPEKYPMPKDYYEREAERTGYGGGWNDCYDEWIEAIKALVVFGEGFAEGYKQAMQDVLEWAKRKETNNGQSETVS